MRTYILLIKKKTDHWFLRSYKNKLVPNARTNIILQLFPFRLQALPNLQDGSERVMGVEGVLPPCLHRVGTLAIKNLTLSLYIEEIPNKRTVGMNGRPLLRTKNVLILASRVRYSGQRNTLILTSRKSVHSLGHTNTLILVSHKSVRY